MDEGDSKGHNKGLGFEFKYTVMNHMVGGLSDGRSVEGNSTKGGYQVWSESGSELESECDNCREMIRLQLMCCAP